MSYVDIKKLRMAITDSPTVFTANIDLCWGSPNSWKGPQNHKGPGVMPYSVPRRIASGERKLYVRGDAIN